MANTTFDRVAKLLPQLTDAELAAVKDRCTVLSKTGKQVVVRKKLTLHRPDPDDWYAHGVGAYAVSKGWCRKEEVAIILSQKGIAHLPNYVELSAAYRGIIQNRLPKKLKQVQLEMLGTHVAEAVALYIQQINERRLTYWLEQVTQTPGEPRLPQPKPILIDVYSLLAHVAHMPEAIEYQFPGYLASGLLGMIIGVKRDAKNT